MDNPKQQQFQLLEKELKSYKPVFAGLVDTIREQGVSAYPIMVISQKEVEIGLPVVDHREVDGNWSVNASTMEEFLARQIILPEKIESFKSLFDSHEQHFCLFVISDFGADFVFLPK
ncbi:MAG TPA: hypothetical protein PKC40_09695 [Saprospiraceae bacterium]|nr:hypothetical protein [Saprospiraceae bacterium]